MTPSARGGSAARLALDLPAHLWGLAVYTVLWFAFAPHHHHLTASVEADFPLYAGLASQEAPLTWHGLAPVGYPWLLRATTHVTDDLFRSGVLLSALGGAWFLLAAYALARRFVPLRVAVFLQVLLAVNWFVLKASLLVGTDVLWAAATLSGLVLLLPAAPDAAASPGPPRARDLLAGACLGGGLLLRYASLSVLPCALAWLVLDPGGGRWGARLARTGRVLLAAVVAASPQWVTAWREAGHPLAHEQVRNVWFGIFGHSDWVSNWRWTQGDLSLTELVGGYPELFLTNLGGNLLEFARLCLTGPLGFQPEVLWSSLAPMAVAVLLVGTLWVTGGPPLRKLPALALQAWRSGPARLLLLVVIGYGISVSMAFWMARFSLLFLPPCLVAAAAVLGSRPTEGPTRTALRRAALMALPVLMLGHAITGWTHVVTHGQQPIDEIRVALVAAGIRLEQDVVMATTLQHYDVALPFRFVQLPLDVQDLTDLQQALARNDVTYLLYERRTSATGSYWPELDGLLGNPTSCSFLEPLLVRLEPPQLALFRAR